MKRVFDIMISLIGLAILGIPLLIIGLLIKFNDKGPVFYRQNRVGKNRKLFRIYKFRTMKARDSYEEGQFPPIRTSQVSVMGRFLRKSKIDEFPQILNVLKGDMSIVGPRPEIEKWTYVYPEKWSKILSVKPGITDNASIIYRNEEFILAKDHNPEKTYREVILPKKLQIYEEYIAKNSFLGDLQLILKTIFTILSKRI